jgi:hypothetical protein
LHDQINGWTQDEHCGLFDAYEPTLMHNALLSEAFNLNPLIFGDLGPRLASISGIAWDGSIAVSYTEPQILMDSIRSPDKVLILLIDS